MPVIGITVAGAISAIWAIEEAAAILRIYPANWDTGGGRGENIDRETESKTTRNWTWALIEYRFMCDSDVLLLQKKKKNSHEWILEI